MNTADMMAVSVQPQAAQKGQSTKAAARTGKGTSRGQDSFDTAMSRMEKDAAALTTESSEPAEGKAESPEPDEGKQAVRTLLAAGVALVPQETGTVMTQENTALATENGAVSESFLPGMNTAGNGVAAMQNTTGDLQSLIPQPAGQKLRQQNFLAMLSGQPLTAEQTGSLSPAADALPNTAVLSDPVSLQNLLLSDQQALPAARENPAAGAVETNPVQQQASMTASALQNLQTDSVADDVSVIGMLQDAAAAQQQSAGNSPDTEKKAEGKNLSGFFGTAAVSVEDRRRVMPDGNMPQGNGDAQSEQQEMQQNNGRQDTRLTPIADDRPAAADAENPAVKTGDAVVLPERSLREAAPSAVRSEAGASHTVSAGTFQQTLQSSLSSSAPAESVPQQMQSDYGVPRQIVEHARLIRNTGDTQMVIKLNPQHLGELTLKVSVSENGAVNASFHSDNAQVRTIIENSLVQLRQELNQQGLKVDSVEVYAGLSDGQLPQEQGQQAWQNGQGGNRRLVRGAAMDAGAYEDDDPLNVVAVQDSQRSAADGVDYRI